MSIMLYNVVFISTSEYELVNATIQIKATEQFYTPFLFFKFFTLNMYIGCVYPLWEKSYNITFQIKATDQYFLWFPTQWYVEIFEWGQELLMRPSGQVWSEELCRSRRALSAESNHLTSVVELIRYTFWQKWTDSKEVRSRSRRRRL